MPRYTSKHTGKKIDDIIDNVVNPNLLDNWYFGNPINQRGQTEYTAVGYMVDRWLLGFDGTLTSTLTDDGIKIAAGNDGTYKNFEQILPYVPTNTTFTMSFLVDNFASITQIYAAFSASQFDIRDNLITCTFKTGGSISDRKSIGIQVKPGKTATIKAAKLELGSQQTLAHQDENGVWQLNEIPDYGEQLARCQRYHFEFGPSHALIAYDGYGVNSPVVYFPVQMRTVSAIKVYSKAGTENAITYWNGSAEVDFTDFSLEWTNNFVTLRSNNGAFAPGGIYSIGKLIAYADL